MDVYDFDHTVYQGDSTIDFWLFCVREKPSILIVLPRAVAQGIAFRLGLCSRDTFKESFFRFLPKLVETEALTQRFWARHIQRVESWYLQRRNPEDVIISASPEFLVSVACRQLGVRWIATRVDSVSGKFLSPNCRGQEKVRRFQEEYASEEIEHFFSDSLSDAPLAALAENAYLVRKGHLHSWPSQKHSQVENSRKEKRI